MHQYTKTEALACAQTVARNLLHFSPFQHRHIVEQVNELASVLVDTDTSDDECFFAGDLGPCSLDDLITGAYWHFVEHHRGQESPEYGALCALGRLYQPGMEEPDRESAVYIALATLARANKED